MDLFGILVLGIGLSLDSFAVSLTLGITCTEVPRAKRLRFLAMIGLFHFLMIFAGWFLGENVSRLFSEYDHWIAFGLLLLLGIKMIREGFDKKQDDMKCGELLNFRHTLLFAVALSIDALVTGFSLGMVSLQIAQASQWVNILLAALIIGLLVGGRVNTRLGSKAEIFGGVILILIGLQIVFEHLRG